MNSQIPLAALVLVLSAVGLGLIIPSLGDEVEAPTFPENAVVPIRMEPLQRQFLALSGSWVYARHPLTWEVRKVPVRLRCTDYQAELARHKQGKPVVWTGKMSCFELTSEEPYEWALWTTLPGWFGGFTVFNMPDKTSYLAFVCGLTVMVTDVTRPVDPFVALQEQEVAKPERLLSCPLAQLAPQVKRWGVNAQRMELVFKSLEQTPEGGLRLEVTNPQGTDTVTVLYKDGTWRLSAGQPDGGPAKTTE